MDVTPLVAQGASIIQSYANGQFRVSGAVYHGPVIVTVDHVYAWAGLDDFSPLVTASDQYDVVLVGCGTAVNDETFVLRGKLRAQGLHVEFMDTGAACRTFNVLMAEGRRVAAALYPIG